MEERADANMHKKINEFVIIYKKKAFLNIFF